MAGISGAMNIAKQALLTYQLSLEVTGQNIANVNNPNFTRQEVLLESAFPVKGAAGAPGMVGTGIRATAIIRRYDQFLESQRIANTATTGYWDSKQDFLARLEVIFNESSEFGLNSQFDNFFLSWQNLAFNPMGLTERTDVVAQGRTMSDMFNKLNQDAKNLRIDLDTKIESSISEINQITGEIAKYNKAIHEAETFNVTANDLRDQRETKIRELAQYFEVNVVEDSNNQVMVSIMGGRPLVIGQTAFTLSTQVRSDDSAARDVFWKDASGGTVEITDEINNGKVGSWIAMRDTEFQGYLDKIDLLAATMVRDINIQHSKGYALDGSTGNNFFNDLTVATTPSRDNTGSATISGSVNALDQLNLHKYKVDYDGSNLTITDLTLGSVVATEAYSAGNPISYFQTQGMNVTISSGAAAQDSFTVSASQDASLTIALSKNILNNTNKIAAALTTNMGDGDNALDIAQLQNNLSLNKSTAASSGTATFSEFYGSLVGQVGVSASQAVSTQNQQESINFELDNRHEQIAGVSLDEEMINLIKFQSAYQASARLVGVIDELLATLVALGR